MSVVNSSASHNTNEIEQALHQGEQLAKKWLVGHGQIQLDDLPSSWHGQLAQLEPAQLNLHGLILTQQQQLVMQYQQPPKGLIAAPDLPELDFPCIAPSLRPLFKRVLAQCKQQLNAGHLPVLNLLSSRQVCAHPNDWMPTKHSNTTPSLYMPWLYWSNKQINKWQEQPTSELDPQAWAELFPAEKRERLTQLRHSDPMLAGQLIQQIAQTELAEKRLQLYQILSVNLSAHDQPILQACLTDKSKKVVTLAKQLLARLGCYIEDEQMQQQAQELAQWYQIKSKGLLKHTTLVEPVPLKNKKQQALRTEFIAEVSLPALASALNISLAQLCQGWQFDQQREQDNLGFIRNVFDSLPEPELDIFITRCCDELSADGVFWHVLNAIQLRCSTHAAAAVLYQLLDKRTLQLSFASWLSLIDAPLAKLNWLQFSSCHAWAELQQEIKQELKEKHYLEHYHNEAELRALGLVLPPEVAQRVYDELIALGMMAADPMLDALKLNIGLGLAQTQNSRNLS
ncbi:DUF5691 domain-containing protein [Motilimonas sp. 1_MG-2023]|uniref:DUF5691 domain-containing protein n=1 Tax=Motilimonas sp. 1_MG-2023 TaxID=3062672 RepID=UPI0026E11C7E|nr:DUF5691 domain-containing protein [Motilimonas sp. 1_MG-2023]MDO6527396.1 DUF5691 domain-containing protein [Motilimonas sp. 1_MG-2023]